MAKINNQEVMQKLIDDLELYPAKDVIPSELAEKILPTFQVNSQDVNVNIKENMKVYRNTTLNSNDKTLAVPDNKIWRLHHVAVKWTDTATVGNRYIRLEILDETGELMFTTCHVEAIAASDVATFYYKTNQSAAAFVDPTSSKKYNHPLPNISIPEGWEIRVYDFGNVDASDDFILTALVNESDE